MDVSCLVLSGDTEAETSETSELKESSSNFTPEMKTEYSRLSYRFKFPGPGVFRCTLTRLVFVMTQAAEVLYRTVVWPDGLLESVGKTPAGMLFNIKCSEGAISQLHLPHCETKEALCFNRFLSVAHITDDDGMSILEPTKITDTHVLVNIPHLSAFGLIWDIILRFLHMKLPINGQVLLFLRPPGRAPPTLDVLLLLGNIPLSEVSAQHEESERIKVSSECLLTADHSYSVRCEPQALIDPKSKTFRTGCGPNFHPTFVVCMTTNPERVTLVVQDQHCTAVWEHGLYIHLPVDVFDDVQPKSNISLQSIVVIVLQSSYNYYWLFKLEIVC
ncbi:hypothetical protein XENOCAPTIV_019371 [Xenoophorus captivus]|uniref:FIIND domain-containing protein n=1 Tax=Xenoophorus captivus TaxID=1517983 RepID=A0ABV0RRV0_9TELE